MPYHAFISYSHAVDGQLAPAIQSGLHRLAKPFYRLRALNVFRDKTGLAATPALWGTIEAALQQSRYFILFASPESAHSEWVNKEVDWWLLHRSTDTVLIVLTAGELVWNAAKIDFNWQATMSLPTALAGRFKDQPLWVDMRWARARSDLSLRDARFLDAVLDLAAPLHGKAKNDLAGEDVKQSRIVRSVSVVAAFVLAVLAVLAWQQLNEARRNEMHSPEQQRIAEERLKNLCQSWELTTAFIGENLQGAIYDIKGRLYEVFKFDENCRR